MCQRSRTTWWEQGEASTTVTQQYQARLWTHVWQIGRSQLCAGTKRAKTLYLPQLFYQQPAFYVADSSMASKARRRGSCKTRALCCAAASKHCWEQTVNAERGRYRSSSRLRTPHPSHLNVIVHSPVCTTPPAVSAVQHLRR